MSNETTTCPICGQPKSASAMGSLTQWIAVCQCGLVEPEAPKEQVSICASCGKRIPETHTGSFTQWVFRSQLCECVDPQPVDALRDPDRKSLTAETPSKAPTTGFIHLPAETFPIERYKPVRELGAGAGGSVYLCWDEHLSKYVSVKVLIHRSDANLIAFQKEAKVTARFKHPNVVSVLDFGVTDGGAPFMVLEYIDGIALDQIIRTEGGVPEEIAISLFIQIADALAHGHESGVYHRDIKSSNILVARQSNEDGQIRLIDFGVAALLGGDQESTDFQGRTVVGTPKYMSPDQALGMPYDARSEIYSFGCVMFETLLGRVPFEEDTALDLLAKHAHEPAPNFEDVRDDVEVSEELEELVLRCLEKDPEVRFQTMKSLQEALQKIPVDDPHMTAKVGKDSIDEAEEPMPPVSTGKWMVIAIAVCVISLIPVALLIVQSLHERSIKEILAKEKKKAKNDYQSKDRIKRLDEEKPLDREKKFDFHYTEMGHFQAFALKNTTDRDLALIKGRKDITAVNLHRTEFEGPGLAYIVDMPIEALDLNETPISDSAIDYVAKMKKLNFLHLQGCNLSDGVFAKLERLPLARLGLGKTLITIEGLRHIARIKTLEILELTVTPNVDAEALKVLKDLPHLRKLFVSATRDKPDVYYETLGTFKNTILFLQGDNISLKNLARLDNVGLGFRGVRITKPHLEVLKKMKNLQTVEFWGCGITDDLLADVVKLHVRELSFAQEPISNEGLQQLAKMRSLRSLLIQCDGVNALGLRILKRGAPKLQIDTKSRVGIGAQKTG